MNKEDLPQDKSCMKQISRELCYVKGTDGTYTTGLSTGWEVKTDALNNAWEDIDERIKIAKEAVQKGEKSPINYFMELRIMDFKVLSGYTGFWKMTIKRHLKPGQFKRLSDKTLGIYAKAFDITIDELRYFDGE